MTEPSRHRGPPRRDRLDPLGPAHQPHRPGPDPEGERQAAGIGAALAGIATSTWCCAARASGPAARPSWPAWTRSGSTTTWPNGTTASWRASPPAEIQERYPGWSVWDGPWPGGETAAEVAARADRVIDVLLRSGATRIAVVGHGHFSRVLAARWLGQDLAVASRLLLDTATWSELGWFRGLRVLRHWNVARPTTFPATTSNESGADAGALAAPPTAVAAGAPVLAARTIGRRSVRMERCSPVPPRRLRLPRRRAISTRTGRPARCAAAATARSARTACAKPRSGGSAPAASTRTASAHR